MLRTVVATSIVLVAVACGGGKERADKPVPTGPAYSPVVANGLRAIAPECKTTKTGTAEQLRCTGAKGLIDVALDRNRFVSLSIGLRSMILGEAKGHLSYALKELVGAPGVEQVFVKLDKLETGDRAELAVGSAKIVLVAGGTSRIAPEYKVEISWQ